MAHTRLLYHIVFATKRREPWLNTEIRPRLWRYISGICCHKQCPLIIAGGVDDHAHLLLETPPTVRLADIVRDVKANSSRFIHEEYPTLKEFAWQTSYAGFSVSVSAVADVRRYIETQEEHHKRMLFIDELRALCDKHGVAWDPRQYDDHTS
jgi:putative transposase